MLVKRNNAKCTAWLAFTMVPRCTVAASMGMDTLGYAQRLHKPVGGGCQTAVR